MSEVLVQQVGVLLYVLSRDESETYLAHAVQQNTRV